MMIKVKLSLGCVMSHRLTRHLGLGRIDPERYCLINFGIQVTKAQFILQTNVIWMLSGLRNLDMHTIAFKTYFAQSSDC